MGVLETLLDWLQQQVHHEAVAIYDATNSTVERRRKVLETVGERDPSFKVIFLECICNDPTVLKVNFQTKLQFSPDYKDVPYDEASDDLSRRVANYEKAYEPLGECGEDVSNLAYITLINISSHIVAHHVYGSATTQLLPFLMSLHVHKKHIWLVRMPHRCGSGVYLAPSDCAYAQAEMDKEGLKFAKTLSLFAQKSTTMDMQACHVYTNTHRRGTQLANIIGVKQENLHVSAALNPMNRGSYTGRPNSAPEVYTSPDFCQQFTARFPGGESHADVVRRLMPLVVEIEQQMSSVIIIGDQSVLQVLHSYYTHVRVETSDSLAVPHHTVTEFQCTGGKYLKTFFSEMEINDSIVSGSGEK